VTLDFYLIFYSISTCLDALFEFFVPEYITLPTTAEALEEASLFHAASSFPPIVWAAVDGTHILVTPPSKHETAFRNRHHSLSLNVMIVCGASGKIVSVRSSRPGSEHDSPIFESSDLFRILHEQGWRPIPNGIILADSAYKGTYPFMCTPFLDAAAIGDPRKERFNECFRRARTKVECCIGQFKAKFPVLRTGIRFKKMEKCSKLVQVRQYLVGVERAKRALRQLLYSVLCLLYSIVVLLYHRGWGGKFKILIQHQKVLLAPFPLHFIILNLSFPDELSADF
jgi:uncharacterized membrane protein